VLLTDASIAEVLVAMILAVAVSMEDAIHEGRLLLLVWSVMTRLGLSVRGVRLAARRRQPVSIASGSTSIDPRVNRPSGIRIRAY